MGDRASSRGGGGVGGWINSGKQTGMVQSDREERLGDALVSHGGVSGNNRFCHTLSILNTVQMTHTHNSLDHDVVTWWSSKADSPCSAFCRTSHGSRREFLRKSGSGLRSVGRG